jgi:hypothetical protein
MKKFIAVAAMLSVMFLGIGTSQALMGVPDAVPGRDILVPFFIVSMDGLGTDNTLITITDVNGIPLGTADKQSELRNAFHLEVMTIDSEVVYNKMIKMTKYDVYVSDALTLIDLMSPDGRTALEVDLDPDIDGNDHYVGYMRYQGVNSGNYFMSQLYQIAVADGIVAGYNGVSMEDEAGGGGSDHLIGYDEFINVEAFSANALAAAKVLLNGDYHDLLEGNEGEDAADSFRLLPRFYLHDEDSINYLIIWTDFEDEDLFNDPVDLALPGTLHVNFYDEAEQCSSANITIDHELKFLNIRDIVPSGLFGTDPLAAGWIDLVTPDGSDNAQERWELNGQGAKRLWLGYSLQRVLANGSGNGTLDVIFEVHRDAGISISD